MSEPHRIGYIRVSTRSQAPDRQVEALRAECDELYIEQVSAVADVDDEQGLRDRQSVMKKLIGNLIWLIAAFATFVLISALLAERLPMPSWMPFDYHDGPWLAAILKLFGIAVLTPPFVLTLVSLFQLGHQKTRLSLWTELALWHGRLRLLSGFRWTMIGLLAVLFCGISLALWLGNEPLGIWLFASPLLLGCLYGIVVFLIVEVEYDEDHLVAMTPFLRWRAHRWSDLTSVEYVSGWQEFRIHFDTGHFARISEYFEGLDQFMAFIEERTAQTASNERRSLD